MSSVSLPLQLAPNNLSQQILPNWGFSFFNINLGSSSNPGLEQQILQEVGSYGKQIGHLSEALEVVIKQLNLLDKDMPEKDKDALLIFMANLAKIRDLKDENK